MWKLKLNVEYIQYFAILIKIRPVEADVVVILVVVVVVVVVVVLDATPQAVAPLKTRDVIWGGIAVDGKSIWNGRSNVVPPFCLPL